MVLKAGQTAIPEEIIAFCRERLTAYRVPRQVEFRSELSKTMVGKLLRRVLVDEERRKAQQGGQEPGPAARARASPDASCLPAAHGCRQAG